MHQLLCYSVDAQNKENLLSTRCKHNGRLIPKPAHMLTNQATKYIFIYLSAYSCSLNDDVYICNRTAANRTNEQTVTDPTHSHLQQYHQSIENSET